VDGEGLRGKVAVVVGGGGGIGAACSRALAGAGATVAILDREAERSDAVAEELHSAGCAALTRAVDVLQAGQLEDGLAQVLAELGSLDVLVNVVGGGAGIVEPKPLSDYADEEWRTLLALNLDYVLRTCRAALGSMIAAGGGAIVNIASMLGVGSAPRTGAYGAAKAALMSMTRTLAVENARYGVRVNAVAPGLIQTPRTSASAVGELFERNAELIPLGRCGRPEDIARAVRFLASPDSDYITGQILPVDGGASVRFMLPMPGAHVTEAP
jgi:NAD(P)-dependent dehydrogenase (short-subunit alcohol dehydrogenase family)